MFCICWFLPRSSFWLSKTQALNLCERNGFTSPKKRICSFFLCNFSFIWAVKLVDLESGCWERTQKSVREEGQVIGQIPALFLPTFSSFCNRIRPLIHALLMPEDLQKGRPVKQTQHAKPTAPALQSGGSLQLPPLKAGHAFSTAFSTGSSLRASYDLILDGLSFKRKTLKTLKISPQSLKKRICLFPLKSSILWLPGWGTVASSRQLLLSLQAQSRQEIHSPLARDRRWIFRNSSPSKAENRKTQ